MLEQDLEFIYQSLMPRTKMQICQLGNMLGCELKSNLRKVEMATGLADYIINRSDEWLRCLPQRELDLLEIMVKMEKGSEFRTFLQPYGTVMEAFGFITEERDDDSSTFTIVQELYDSIKEHLPITTQEFMAAGFNPLYPFVGKDSPSGKKLTSFMEKIGLGEEERNVIGTLVWLNAQEGGTKGPINAMHLFDGLLKGFDQLQEMMGIVQEYMNNVPKWIFKGYSSHEVFEKYEKPNLQPLPDKMPPMGFGMGVPRVGRNDLCPCGSGLKYKNCHGKYKS